MIYPSLLRAIMSEGKTCHPHGKEIKELMHIRLEVDDPLFYWKELRPLEKLLAYWKEEWSWYMTGKRCETAQIEKAARLWSEIKNEDGSLNSNYGYLVFYQETEHPSMGRVTMTPFEWARRSLQLDMDSRQAMMTYNNGGYNFMGNRDYICTQHQAFYIRENRLFCYVALRSSDAIWGLAYNMPWWNFVAQQLLLGVRAYYPGIELAPIEVDIYSAHIYARHFPMVEKLLESRPVSVNFTCREIVPLDMEMDFYRESFERFVCVNT